MTSDSRTEGESRGFFRQTVIITAESTAVISFFSAIASIISSYVKFSRIGINVWDVVSFDDIFVGALESFVFFLENLPIIFIPIILIYFFLEKIFPSQVQRKFVDLSRGAAALFVLIQFFATIVRMYPENIFSNFIDVQELRYFSLIVDIKVYLTFSLLICCWFVIPLCVSRVTDKWKYSAPIIIFSVLLLLIGVSARQGEVSLVYLAAYNDELFAKVPNCFPSTVWVGSNSVLVSCMGGNGGPFVVLNRSEVMLMDYDLFSCTEQGQKLNLAAGINPADRCKN